MRILLWDVYSTVFPLPETIKQAIRLAAESGFTHFMLCSLNMIRIPSVERACRDWAYTPEQWREFETAAREAGVELIPYFNVTGHTERICETYPELTGRPGERELDVTRRETREWTARCLEEFCAFASGRSFVIGGDEWQPPGRLLAEPGFSVAAAWAGQINFACECLKRLGRTPIVWYDMLLHYPEALDLLSREAVVAFWNYEEDEDYPVLDTLKTLGFRTIMATGLIPCFMSRRHQRSIQAAVKAAERHRADGLMVTCWGDGGDARWEKQTINIPLAGGLLRGQTIPAAILETLSIIECLGKIPSYSRYYTQGRDRVEQLLNDESWARFPDFLAWAAAHLNGDRAAETVSFTRFHHPVGPVFEALQTPPPKPESAPAATTAADCKPDGEILTVTEGGAEGPVLRFVNGDETFVIYPKYGASLQDWRAGKFTLIRHYLTDFLRKPTAPPGGLASYTGALGFRPIWALGAHHNPCIIWQGPFDWRVLEDTSETVIVELTRSMYHVDVRYRISVRRGQPGFEFEARAVNKLKNVYGGFNFNLPLSFPPDDTDRTYFEWGAGNDAQTKNIMESFDSYFRLPPASRLTLRTPAWIFTLICDQRKTTGFYTDWQAGFVTPDLHASYRKMAPGDSVTVRWRLTVKQNISRG